MLQVKNMEKYYGSKNNLTKAPDGVSVADLSESELAKFRRERLGFVFQDFNLLVTLTIEENIGLALSLNHQDPETAGILPRNPGCFGCVGR